MIRSSGLLTGMRFLVLMFGCDSQVVAYGATIGTEAPGARRCGQADPYHEPRARVVSWPPLRLARLRRERESVVVVWPAAPVMYRQEVQMRRVIGIDIHRTFGEVVYWEDGRLRRGGRIDMTRTALEGFGKGLLASDEVVIE